MSFASYPKAHIRLLLFDLGGVLVDFSGPRELGQYLRKAATPHEILERWIACPHTDQFERGVISPTDWAERFVREWDVSIEPAEFLRVFRTMTRCVLPGARELLEMLQPRFRLAALSNSNAVHWDRNKNEMRLLDLFEFAIASHEVGLCKPDPRIYEAALHRAQLPPGAVMFFDDLPANVAAARALGIHARQVKGVEAIRECLAAEGLLEDAE